MMKSFVQADLSHPATQLHCPRGYFPSSNFPRGFSRVLFDVSTRHRAGMNASASAGNPTCDSLASTLAQRTF
ncbi:MAG TPA: hypothetical protein VGL08_19885 [Paraburkholderia sp.]|jgi:hypothetical protein